MRWLMQSIFDTDPKVIEIKNNLNRLDISYTNCKVIPFSEDEIEFEDDNTYESLKNEFIFVYGSYTLARISKLYFSPASFISPNLSIDNLYLHYGNEMFNSDMVVGSINDIDAIDNKFFIRPTEDTKSFCGEVVTREWYNEWKKKIMDTPLENYSTITKNTKISMARIKQIDQEVRCFVIDDKVVTASQYKQNGSPFFHPHVDDYIIDYVNNVIKTWKPDDAFCMDIALTNGIPKILETNCINSSGLYCIDTQKFIMAICDLESKYNK